MQSVGIVSLLSKFNSLVIVAQSERSKGTKSPVRSLSSKVLSCNTVDSGLSTSQLITRRSSGLPRKCEPKLLRTTIASSIVHRAEKANRVQGKRGSASMPGEATTVTVPSHSAGEGSSVVETPLPNSKSDLSAGISAFLEGLMPKEEIGAKRFLQNHPGFDGRGVIVAILDSGVDPGAAGLQTTTDGKPKILDVLDCTGSGDVDTSTIVKGDEESCITGASGARLQLNPAWKNPSGEWRIGSKRVFELFGDSLVARISGERKKRWDLKHRELVTDAVGQLAAFDSKNGRSSLDDVQKKQREELQSRVDALNRLAESYEDSGPLVDAVVWHDGEHWRAALDTADLHKAFNEEDTAPKLADFEPMTNFRIERKFGTFSRRDACNYVLNIYNDGNILSIVTDVTSHGTHVAGITAAHHPEEPALNGMAPGAQLISCKIGDTRLGSMETGTGLTRALIAVVQHKCDLINMSYGEPTTMAEHGRFIQLANEVVRKHGVIFVSSAGNNGPALTTVGAPGGTSEAIIGIGAYVSPAMAAAAHSLVEAPEEGLPYTWSSRGPTPDGEYGVNLSAPGGAIAPVSQWSLQRRQLMNGTSMASPCACGGIALVLSGLKASGQVVAPNLVRQALENSALPGGTSAEDVLAMGSGLLQVDRAFEYLQKCKDMPDRWYKVAVANAGNSGTPMRGVYLREPHETKGASEWKVSVTPGFHEDGDNLDLRLPFEERIALKPSVDWVKAPNHLLLSHNGRTFNIRVDPTQLPEGVHVAEVAALDLDAPWRGSLFKILVTVIKPTPVPLSTGLAIASFSGLKFDPGHIERRFVEVPVGATWAEATIKLSQFDTPRMFLVHALQLVPKRRYSYRELKSYLTFPSPTSKNVAFAVEGGATLELTLAQFWSSGSGSTVPAVADVEIEFHGLQADTNEVCIDGNVGATRVDVLAPFAVQKLAPNATLSRVRTSFRPSEAKLEPLGPWRDVLPDGRQIHSLLLTYKLSLAEAGKYTPRLPTLNHRMYENEFEAQYYMLFDTNKKLLSQGNVYPQAVKLAKGDYVLRLLLRHDSISLLEKLKKLPLLMDRALEDKGSVKLTAHTVIDGVVSGEHAMKPTLMAPGERRPLFFAGPPEDKLPKDAVVGTVLLGRVTYGKVGNGGTSNENGQNCPAWSRLTYVVPQPSKTEDKSKEKTKGEARKSAIDRLEEEIRDARVKLLGSLPRSSDEDRLEYEEVAEALLKEYPEHLPLLVELLHFVDEVKGADKRKAALPKIIEAADNVVQVIDRTALAVHFAMKSDTEGSEAAKVKKEMEAQRDALVDALYRKGLALAEQQRPSSEASGESDAPTNGSVGGTKEKSPLPDLPSPSPSPADATELTSEEAPTPSALSANDETGGASGRGPSVVAALTATSKHSRTPSEPNSNGSVKQEVSESSKKSNAFEENYAEIRKWADLGQTKHALLTVKRESAAGRPALALQALNKMLEDESKPADKALHELRVELLAELGYSIWADYNKRWNAIRFPPSYPLF